MTEATSLKARGLALATETVAVAVRPRFLIHAFLGRMKSWTHEKARFLDFGWTPWSHRPISVQKDLRQHGHFPSNPFVSVAKAFGCGNGERCA